MKLISTCPDVRESPREQLDETTPTVSQSHQLAEKPSLLKHGIWVFAGRLTNVGIAALSTFVVARLLSKEEFGRFSSMLAATQLISLIGIFGLDQAVIREVGRLFAANNPQQLRPLLRSFMKLALIAQLASAAAAVAFLLFFGSTLIKEQITLFALLSTVLFTASRAAIQTAGETARALDDPLAANLLGGTAGGSFGTAGFLFLLYFASWTRAVDWGTAMALYFAASMVPLIAILYRVSRSSQHFPEISPAELGTSFRDLIRQSALPLFLISVVAFGSSRADVLLLSFFRGPEDVAIYEAARRLSLLPIIPLAVANLVVITSISRFHAAGENDKLQHMLQAASAFASIPCLALCALYLVVPEWILEVCFGSGYSSAATVLRVLVPGQIVFVLTGTCGLALAHTGYAHLSLAVNAATAVITVIAAPFAISGFGIQGLASVITVVTAVGNGICWWLAWKYVGVWTHPRYIHLRQQLLASPD